MRMLSPAELKARESKYSALAAVARSSEADPELVRFAETNAAKAKRSYEQATRSILDYLPPVAVASEIAKARELAAVRVGEQAFLPVASKLMRVLPNALVRLDAIFSLTALPEKRETIQVRAKLDEYLEVWYNGEQLTREDVLAYAAVLDLYRDRPVGGTVKISYGDFIRRMYAREDTTMSIGPGTLAAARASVLRLWSASLRVVDTTPKPTDNNKLSRRALDIGLPRFFEVQFDEQVHGKPSLRDTIEFTVAAQTAELFGPLAWSRIPHATLMRQGLRGRLLTTYATHTKPYCVPLARLKDKIGYTSAPSDFRKALQKLVTEWQQGTGPASEQLVKVIFTADAEFQKQHPDLAGLDSVLLVFGHFPCTATEATLNAAIEEALTVAKLEFARDAGRRAAAAAAAAAAAEAKARKKALKKASAVAASDDAIEGTCARVAEPA